MIHKNKVLSIIRETRQLSLPFYGNVKIKAKKSSSPHDIVTELDQQIEKFLAEELKKVDPNIEFTGEEFGGKINGGAFWICDPIDGTAHYVRGLPYCSTMLALIENGQVVFSAVYDFVNDIIYHAEKGKGAYANNERIHVSDRSLENAYLSTETHIEKPENYANYLKLKKNSTLIHFIACGHEFALIASGKLDGRICFDPFGHDWDYAPGSLLVSEAGGISTNLGSSSYDYRNHDYIFANKKIYDALTQGENAIFPINH